MVTLDLSRVHGSDQLLAMLMTCASAWMESALADPAGGQRWVIYDEAWRLMRQPALLARWQSQGKLARGLGIANLLVVHRLSDFDAVGDAGSEVRALALGLLGDCSTNRLSAGGQRGSACGRAAGADDGRARTVTRFATRRGPLARWRRAFVVRHLATDAERSVFNTNQRMTSPAN